VQDWTDCSVCGDTPQYSLQERFPPAYPTGDTTDYLFTDAQVFSSCIWRYLVSHACDWVMSALSAMLLTFGFQFSLLFCALTQLRIILLDDLVMIWWHNQAMLCTYVMPYHKCVLILAENVFLCAAYSSGERLWIDSNGNKLAPYGTDSRLLLTAKFKVTWHKNWTKIKNSVSLLPPNLRIRGHLPALIINGGGDSLWKWPNSRL